MLSDQIWMPFFDHLFAQVTLFVQLTWPSDSGRFQKRFLVFAFHAFHRNPKGNHKIEIRLFPDPRTTA
jgi:hypothetical protein